MTTLDTASFCKLSGCKKRGTESCNQSCYPFVLMHSYTGDKGYWGINNVPFRYKDLTAEVLNDLDLPKEYKLQFTKIFNKIGDIVDNQHVGLYLFSKASGTGKTTLAVSLMNEYLIYRVEKFFKDLQTVQPNEKRPTLDNSPVFFISSAEYQNIYSGQFRDTDGELSERYKIIKDRMKKTDLLIIDDIAIRNVTEAFNNELFEVIDYRTSQGKPMIITSNVSIDELERVLGQRIASRVKGSCVAIGVVGSDKRKVELKL